MPEIKEKNYVICEYRKGDYDMAGLPSIPESELRRRIGYIRCHDEGYDADIQTLLRGEGKEPCYICKKVDGHEAWCSRGRQEEPEKPQPGPDDILRMRGKEPSTPTRNEWEEWAERAETAITMRDHIREALLTIPCNPRRKV